MNRLTIFLFLLTYSAELWARSDQFTTCIVNLKQIDGTAYRYMEKAGLSETNSYSLSDPALLADFKNGVLPRCPSGGSYLPGATFFQEPVCSAHGTIEQINDQIRARIRRERMTQYLTLFGVLVVGGGMIFICSRLLRGKQSNMA